MEVDGIQAGHDQDSGQKTVNIQARVNESRQGPGKCADKKGERDRQKRINTGNDENGSRCRSSRETSVDGDIREIMHTERDENPHGHECIQKTEV